MDDQYGGLGVGALAATTGQRTPSKSPAGRAFGTRLSANSPLQVQREKYFLQLQQGTAAVPKSAPSLSRSERRKGRLATINETTRSGKKKKDTRLRSHQKVVDGYNDEGAVEKHYSAATSSARKLPSSLTSTTASINREGLDYSTIGATTPSSALRSTARSVATAASATISTSLLSITPTNTEHRGKNLIDNFNSTSSPAIIDVNDKTYTPQSVKKTEKGSTQTKPWTNVTSSASSWGLAAFKLPPSSYKSEYDTAVAKTLTPPLRVLWKELGDGYRPSPADRRSSNTTSTILSPSLSSKKVLFASSLVSSSSYNVSSSNPSPTPVATPKEITIGPSEYAMCFPSGQLSLHLVFEPVTQTFGRMMGCGIAKISPLFYDKLKSHVFNYFPAPASSNVDEVDGALPEAVEKLTIQVNDLVVSINGISVLSRKYDVIMQMLHDEQYQYTDRIIVFRSIEKLWHSRSSSSSSYSNHFTRRTMRHLRTGRRVATALNDDILMCNDDDNSNNGDSVLRTWVETPTQVPLRHSRKNRLMNVDVITDDSNADGSHIERPIISDMLERRNDFDNVEMIRRDCSSNLNALVKDNEDEEEAAAADDTRLISSSSLMSPTSKATSLPAATKTPSYVLEEIDIMTMIPFSPSNVKKMMKSGGSGIKCKRSDYTITSPQTQVTRVQLLTAASPAASTVKRNNSRRSSSKPQLQTIDERLSDVKKNITAFTRPSPPSHTMERIGKILMGNETMGDLGADFEHSLRLKKAVLEEIKYVYFLLFVGEKKQRTVNDRRDVTIGGSEPIVHEENDVSVEGLVMPTPSHKIMFDMKSRLNDSYSKVKELEEEVLVLKKLSTPTTDPGVRRALLTQGPTSYPSSAGRSSSNIFDIDDRFLDPKWGIIRESGESAVRSPIVDTSNHLRHSEYSLASGGVVSLTNLYDDMEHENKEKAVMRKEYEDIVGELQTQISDLVAKANERDASHAEQVRTLEYKLSGKDYDAIVTTLEQRVAVIEADGDIVRLELENTRSDLVKTKEEADAALRAMLDKWQAEKDEFIFKCTAIDIEKRECVKKLECVATQKVEALNKRISVVVVDRETVRLELEKARMDTIKANEDADATLNEVLAEKDKVMCIAIDLEKRVCIEKLECVATEKNELEVQLRKSNEELVSFKERITFIEADREGVCRELEEKLGSIITEKEELEVQLRESNEELLRFEERVVSIEADRDGALLELEQARIATDIADSALKTMLDEILAEKNKVVFKCSNIESEKRECIKILDRVTTEKEEVEDQLRESIEELVHLNEQVQTLSETNSKLELTFSTTVAEFAETRQALKQEMLHCHEQIITLEKQVHSLESTLEVVARDKVDMQQQLIDLDTAGLRLACEKENLNAQLQESNDQLKRVKIQVLRSTEERNNVNMRISTASCHLSKARETIEHQNHYASTFEEQVRGLEKSLAMKEKVMGNMQQLVKKLDAAGLRLACEKEEVEAQLKESNDQLAKVTDQVSFLSEEKNMLRLMITKTATDLANSKESIKLHKSEMQERESVTNEKIVSQERCIAAANESFANEQDTWIGRLNKLEVEVSEGIVFKTEIESLSSSISLLDSKLAAAESTVNALTLDLTAKENELICLRQESKLERESMNLQLDNLNDVVNELQASKNDVISQNATLVAEVSNLSEKLVESSNATQRHKELYIDLKFKLEAAEDLLDEGDGELDQLHSECERLEKKVSDLQALVINAEDAAVNAKEECKSLTNQNESMACRLNTEIKNLREGGRDFIDQIKNAEKLHDLSSQDLMNKLAKSQDDVIDRKTLVTDLESKLQIATTSLAEANANIQILGLDFACLKKQANDLEKLLANEKDASSSHHLYVSELKNDIALLNESLIVREQEKLSLLSDLRELEVTINDLTSGLQHAETQFNSQMKMNILQQQELVSRNNELTLTVEKLSTNLHGVEAKSCRDLLSHEVARSQLMVDIRDLQNFASATKIKLEKINSDHLQIVKEKDSELESKAVVIMSNKQEIVRLTNKVASLEQVLVLLESEGTTTMDDVDTTRKYFERERESLNDCIQELQLKLCESLNAVKKEESELESLRDKLSVSNQIEQDLREKVSNITQLFNVSQDEIKRLSDELDTVMECHEISLSKIGEKQRSSIETISHSHNNELHAHKINVDQLQQRLLEETDLCSSLRDLVTVKEQTMHDQLSEIDLLNKKIKSIKQRMSDAESQFTREKQQLCSTINEQKLAQELSTQSEMRLGLMLNAMRFDYDQVVVNFSDTREAIAKSIESFKQDYNEVVQRVVNAFKVDKFVSRREIESVSNLLSQAMKHYQVVLALKDEKIQRQEDSLHKLQLQLNEATHGFEIENVSYKLWSQSLQDAVDENVSLKSELECAQLAYSDQLSTIESDWKSFQLALYQLTACILHEDDHVLPIEALPDTTTLLQTFVELFQQKLDQISTLKLQLTTQSEDLLSKLNNTKQKMDEMSCKLSSETSYRQLAEIKCIAAEAALANEKVRISVLEHQSEEMEEDALLQAKEIDSLKAHIEEAQSNFDEMNTKDQLLSREARDLELRLDQAKRQKKRLELKYERSLAEIESCKKDSNDLMTILIEKKKDVQSMEGKVLDLQYQVDDLQSKIDGWMCAFNGLASNTAEQLKFSSPDDVVANVVATRAFRQDKQTADIAKLEKQCLQLKEEMRQQALMHQAIVSGLESECQSLSDECFDVNGNLKEKNEYVFTLEHVKCQLMAKADTLAKEKEDLHRRLCDLQTTCNILRQQKLDAKSLSNDNKSVISAVKMLAGIATVHITELDGFSCTDTSRSTWSEDVDFILRFIEHMSLINQKYSNKIERVKDSIRSPKTLIIRGGGVYDVAENSSTPTAKGRNVASTELVVIPTQHSDILEDFLCVKNSITSIMSSPKLSTSKKERQGEKIDNNDLYTDLLNAHDQLKSLSGKIEAMTADQRYYKCRIFELEQENEKYAMMIRTFPLDVRATVLSDERMKVAGALLLSNIQQRHNRLLLQTAFMTWNSKVRMCKQVGIAKDMAKELIKTRKTVLLLKSQMEIE